MAARTAAAEAAEEGRSGEGEKEVLRHKLEKLEGQNIELKENLIVRDFIKRKMSDDCASEHDLLVMPNQDVK